MPQFYTNWELFVAIRCDHAAPRLRGFHLGLANPIKEIAGLGNAFFSAQKGGATPPLRLVLNRKRAEQKKAAQRS